MARLRNYAWFVLMCAASSSMADTLEVHRNYFVAFYDTRLNVPVRTIHVLAKSMLSRRVSRKGISFYSDNQLPRPRVSNVCFSHSGFDKGHMVPAADMSFSDIALRESFSFLNICPQMPKVNRKAWKKVEDICRKLAKKYSQVNVISESVFVRPDTTWLHCHHSAIPDGFRKVVRSFDNTQVLLDTIIWQRNLRQEE